MSRRGASLAEVAVALVLVSLAWAAVTGLHLLSVRAAREAALREEVRRDLQSVADSVDRASAGSGRVDRVWGWVDWSGEGPGTRYEAWIHGIGPVAVMWSGGQGP